jgi:hypothetical protein
MEKVDIETAEALREGDAVKNYIESEGWKIVKGMILERIRVLDSISALPTDLSPEDTIRQLMLRSGVIDFANGLIEDVEARADQHRQQEEMSGIIIKEEIVRRYSSPV